MIINPFRRVFETFSVASAVITMLAALSSALADEPRMHISDGDTLRIGGERMRL